MYFKLQCYLSSGWVGVLILKIVCQTSFFGHWVLPRVNLRLSKVFEFDHRNGLVAGKKDEQESYSPREEDLAFVDNDLYERDSQTSDHSTGAKTEAQLTSVANYPEEEEETYEIPEDVVNELEHEYSSPDNFQGAPPVPPRRTSSASPRSSAYFSATPPVPKRHSSLGLTSFTPPLPKRYSSVLTPTPEKLHSKSSDKIFGDKTPKLPPRLSLALPPPYKNESPKQKRKTFAGHFVPMPLKRAREVSESSSDTDLSTSSDESDFEELPPPREHAPPIPEGAVPLHACAPPPEGATSLPDPAESEYLEPISLREGRHHSSGDQSDDAGQNDCEDDHDYDPVYIPSSPGASHIAHLVDNTNYLKGARNRSASKASINPYEEIPFGPSEDYADVDESTMTSPSRLEAEPTPAPAPPRLTPRSSRTSDLITGQITPHVPPPRSPLPGTDNTPLIPPRPPSVTAASDVAPKLPPRSPSVQGTPTDAEASFRARKGIKRLPSEPRYSGLLADSKEELQDHEYTPLDYEDHQARAVRANGPVDKETTDKQTPHINTNHTGRNNSSADANRASPEAETTINTDSDYEAVAKDDDEEEANADEIYEPIEGADRDGIYEAIDFGD